MKNEAIAQSTVKSPSRMKIHAHPGFPCFPFMSSIAAASNPENAPESDAAEKNNVILKMITLISAIRRENGKTSPYRSESSLRV